MLLRVKTNEKQAKKVDQDVHWRQKVESQTKALKVFKLILVECTLRRKYMMAFFFNLSFT